VSKPVRVLVVDDSGFMRLTIARCLERDSGIVVVGRAVDGLDALDKVKALKPDVVTLDVEMPRMDGLTALKRIMAECSTPVVMLSSLTKRGAGTTIRALMRGAVDFVAKPSAGRDIREVMTDLIAKVKIAAGVRLARLPEPVAAPSAPVTKLGPRKFHKGDPLIIIGASTGGPSAVREVLSSLPANLPAAVAVVQHMPAGFTRSLAERLNEQSPLNVQEVVDGDHLACGMALVAQGDFHMRLRACGRVKLDHGPRQNHVRPAVDVTMETAARLYGSDVIGVVLTGMGHDGRAGTREIKAAGGMVIVQDESTCVVYGMPRSVVEAGMADRVVPLQEVASTLVELV